jgi:hypothetical protein
VVKKQDCTELLAPTRAARWVVKKQDCTELLAPTRAARSVALSFPKLAALAKENWRARQDSNL